MGGFGSGRTSYRRKADDCRSIDITKLKRWGSLGTRRRGSLSWSVNSKEVGRIGYHSTPEHFTLEYRICLQGGEWEPVTQQVPLTYADCNYGGKRPYFRCTGVVNGRYCGRRVGKLFLDGKYFLCRTCHNLPYSSQSEGHFDRRLRRANKLRQELGGEPGMINMIAFKPKGMWQRTYQRKVNEIRHCEAIALQAYRSMFADRFGRTELDELFDT